MVLSTLHHHRSLLLPTTKTLISPNTTTNSSNKLGFPVRIRSASIILRARDSLRPAIDENPEGIISNEWPKNFFLFSYDDLCVYLKTRIISEGFFQGAKEAPLEAASACPRIYMYLVPALFDPSTSSCSTMV